MSFYSPKIFSTEHDFLNGLITSQNFDFVIGPYEFSKEKILKARHPIVNNLDALILFDLPTDLVICINDVYAPSTIFDYLNPLLIQRRNLEKIEFYRQNTLVNSFVCKCMTSKCLKGRLNRILSEMIYYPPHFCINYDKFMLVRLNKGPQFCDLISLPPDSSTLPGIPLSPQLFTAIMNTFAMDEDEDVPELAEDVDSTPIMSIPPAEIRSAFQRPASQPRDGQQF